MLREPDRMDKPELPAESIEGTARLTEVEGYTGWSPRELAPDFLVEMPDTSLAVEVGGNDSKSDLSGQELMG